MRRIKIAFIIFIALFFVNSRALALDIGLIGADDDLGFVTSYLQTTGFALNITEIDARSVTPGLSALNNYDSVLVWSNYLFQDSAALGNNLADYVDAGGGVVLAPFDFYNGWALEGRIMNTTYSPFSPTNYSYTTTATLGAHDSSSPLMSGVNSLSGYYRDVVDLNPGATPVAYWNWNGIDNEELAAWGHSGQVVGINLYPGTYQSMSGDYARLFANALYFSAGQQPGPAIPEPASMSLLGMGLLGLVGLRKKREA